MKYQQSFKEYYGYDRAGVSSAHNTCFGCAVVGMAMGLCLAIGIFCTLIS